MASTGASPQIGTYYWVRFRVQTQGSTAVLSLRVWADGSAEPSSWSLTATDATPLLGGLAGIRGYDGGHQWNVDHLAVGDLSASGSSVPVAVVVTGAALSLSSPVSLSAGTVTLNGSAQTITSTLPLTVTDARGTGAGWALSLSAADPKSASSATIPFTNLALAPQTPALVDSSGAPVGGLTIGSSGNLSGSDTTPGVTPSSASALLTAPPSNGMGMYSQNESVGLTVPASAATGVYTTSLVLAVQ